ncbi:Glycosyltransferase involved in cell wall bisynthesis [Vreelandella subglaciescola]|jgi:glycosyltransferase involved in cell wall biosynthesis|uniref:Glycosyltransferase involved in cell wall bisynthesis n=1 Tax=Vreelandella subglaciescola TaxID=29571 RepID=A0A1M7HC73_9GAMM|nr:Glycosyltransferase involved in cell wall bisynthesis [Halomonas subglaciescola]
MSELTKLDNEKIRLLFFFSGTGRFRYGVAEVFRHVLNGLDKERYEPYLVITGTLEEPVDDLSDAVEVIELGRVGLKKAFFPLVRVIRQIRPDVVVSAMEHPNALAVVARLVARRPCKLLLTSHNVLTPRLQYMWSRREGHIILRAIRLTYPYADHVVCVSEAVRQDLHTHVPRLERSSVIHNPVLSQAKLPDPSFECKEQGLIVTSSRLTGYKRVDEVIRALQLLDDHFHLIVLGDGPERARLEALVTELDLNDRVEFMGYVDDPFAYYRQAEIFILPSMWEGFGNVLIESMACGCQVVANGSAWAPPEVLGHGDYGFLYEGGDPEKLASAIREAADHPKPQGKLLEYAGRFTDQRAAREYEALFDSLLDQAQFT